MKRLYADSPELRELSLIICGYTISGAGHIAILMCTSDHDPKDPQYFKWLDDKKADKFKKSKYWGLKYYRDYDTIFTIKPKKIKNQEDPQQRALRIAIQGA